MMIADIQSFAMIFTDILEFSVRCYSRYMDHVASVSCRVVCINLNHVAGMSQRAACAQKKMWGMTYWSPQQLQAHFCWEFFG